MELQDLGAIGETVSGVAVLVTLLYLAHQLRQNTAIERASGQRDLLRQVREWWELALHHPTLFDQIRRGLHDWESLEPNEQDQVNAWAFSLFHILEQATYMHQDGFINEVSYRGFMAAGLAVVATPGGRVWWSHARNIIGDDISIPVDEELANRSSTAANWNEILPHLRSIGVRV